MSGADNVLETIVWEFPEYKKKITELYNESSNFIEICEDYVLCQESIKKLEIMNPTSKEKEIIELKSVRTELREELLSRI